MGNTLTSSEKDALMALLIEFKEVFAWSYEDMSGIDTDIVQHCIPKWLANVVLLPKKDEIVRMCVDLRDLNKASPKDDFPLPHIDILVDNIAGHALLLFMDGFSGFYFMGDILLQGHAIWP